ncbi:MAG: CotH kinase family protein [Oscillospiraceae bacterium]
MQNPQLLLLQGDMMMSNLKSSVKSTLMIIFIMVIFIFTAVIIPEPDNKAWLFSVVNSGISAPQSASLPLILISTQPSSINHDNKVKGSMTIIEKGELGQGLLHRLTSASKNSYCVGIKIKEWSSEVNFPKKQFSLEIDKDVSLLDLPADSGWVLQNPYTDKSLIRNALVYELSRQMGHYAPRARFVELYLSETQFQLESSNYRGVYLLTEQLKRSPESVNSKSNNLAMDPSGEYLLEISSEDQLNPDEFSFKTNQGTTFIIKYPRNDKINPEEKQWINNYMNDFEKSLWGGQYSDPNVGYANYIDINSFIDYMLLNELVRNPDVFIARTFLYKDKGAKLKLGPVWNYDIAIGNVDTNDNWKTEGWWVANKFWAARLLTDENFARLYASRWRELRKNCLSDQNVAALIDGMAAELQGAQTRNFKKWPIMGVHVWPNPDPCPQSYEQEIQSLKQWLHQRSTWMDAHIEDV